MGHGAARDHHRRRQRDPGPAAGCAVSRVVAIGWTEDNASMTSHLGSILVHLVTAVIAGGCIGLERSFHAGPSGFRSHTLVALTSSLLMLVTLYQDQWLPGVPLESVRIDPTRMAQGIMTGIGFLGAGVIFKEGLSIRGLTTAASIWITAAIGILTGIGFYVAAGAATLLVLGTLSVFRWIEQAMPNQIYAHHHVQFERGHTMPEASCGS